MTGPAMIRRRVTIPASTERVWEAITDTEQIPRWFGGSMDWALEPGGGISFRGEDGEVRAGRVEEVRPGRHLRFVWWPVDPEEDGYGEASEVTYVVEPVPGGTVLTVQETPVGPSRAQASPGATDARALWDDWDSRLAGAWADLSNSARTGART